MLGWLLMFNRVHPYIHSSLFPWITQLSSTPPVYSVCRGQWICPQRGLCRRRGVEGCGVLTSVFDHCGGYNPFYSTWWALYWPCGPTPCGETSAFGAQWRHTGRAVHQKFPLFPSLLPSLFSWWFSKLLYTFVKRWGRKYLKPNL